jgi:acyl dehydratase
MIDFEAYATVREGDMVSGVVVDEVTRAMFVRYAGASGDFNPIHWDREFARGAGYDDVFGMGMFAAGVMAGFLSSWLGRQSIRDFRCRFIDQVWAGDRLVCEGRVVRVYAEAADRRASHRWADCELRIDDAIGKPKVLGWATCLVTGPQIPTGPSPSGTPPPG